MDINRPVDAFDNDNDRVVQLATLCRKIIVPEIGIGMNATDSGKY